MLVGVVEEGTGQAVLSDIVSIAGKTGTARLSWGAAGCKSGWSKSPISFCGYFPADKPVYSVVVIRRPRMDILGGNHGGRCL